jgi:dTDP-4-dehydrorhamnose 3,5-epimerase
MDSKEPVLIPGGLAVDDRGTIMFANEFSFPGVKRFYAVSNFETGVVRAWHGHRLEGKYVLVSSGSAIIAVAPLDSKNKLSKKTVPTRYILSARKPSVLWIPPGFANGFRPLEAGTQLFFFSTSTLEESKGDDYRFAFDYLGETVWQIENR